MLRKTFLFSIIFFIFVFVVYTLNSISIQNSLANKVLRLHILANSNSIFDQELKLEVRDKIVEYLTPKLKKSNNLKETKKIISENLYNIESIAKEIVSKKANYSVAVSLDTSMFPTKHYKNISFPAGNYEALKVVIGNGSGNNWWCVMFPPLCFTNSSAGEFADSSTKLLKENLSKEEYNFINSTTPNLKIKFRLLELWNS